MQKNKTLLFLFLFNHQVSHLIVSLLSYSQSTDSLKVKLLKGQVIDSETKKPLSASHIINLNMVIGTITDDKGFLKYKPERMIL